MNSAQPVNVLVLMKGGERYLFTFDDASAAELHRTLGRFAADTDLSFTWFDAAKLSVRSRRLVAKTTP